MANDKRFIAKNGLQAQNIAMVSANVAAANTITVTMLDSGTLSFSGSSGQLFSISDTMSGTIFAVNDISGVPSIEVLDTGLVRLAETFGTVGVGNTTPASTDKLSVTGGNAYFGANVSIGGTLSSANSVVAGNIVLHAGNYNTYTPTLTGTGASGTWGINVTGNAATATKLQTARTITLSGDVVGSMTFDGSANVTISAVIQPDSVALGTDTTGNYVGSITNGSYITGADGGSEGATLTLSVDANSAAVASKIVARDALSNFSANTISIVGISANNSVGSAGQVLTSNGSGVYWSTVTGGGGSTGATISDTAPSSPTAGQLWFDSTSASLAIYYTDADSSQWVEVVGPTGPTGPENSVARALAMTFVFN